MTDDEINDRKTLEYLCWHFGSSAERFWPVEESARDCMESVSENYEDRSEMDWEKGFSWERGQHSRAVTEAASLFEQLHSRGYDPVQLAENEIERSREEGLDLPDIDWSWLQFSPLLPDEYVEQYVDLDDES